MNPKHFLFLRLQTRNYLAVDLIDFQFQVCFIFLYCLIWISNYATVVGNQTWPVFYCPWVDSEANLFNPSEKSRIISPASLYDFSYIITARDEKYKSEVQVRNIMKVSSGVEFGSQNWKIANTGVWIRKKKTEGRVGGKKKLKSLMYLQSIMRIKCLQSTIWFLYVTYAVRKFSSDIFCAHNRLEAEKELKGVDKIKALSWKF